MEQLREKGYMVFENVLNEEEVEKANDLFDTFYDNNDIDAYDTGIIKSNFVGHQEHAHYIRTRPNVINIFKQVWNCDELICSFDGTCYMSRDHYYNKYWTHVDQCYDNTEFSCYQGLVSLTDNEHKSLLVYENTHKLYDSYVKQYNLSGKNNFNIIDEEYVKGLKKKIIKVKKGSMILWDSRLFHQNYCGDVENNEERIVQYVCYFPKDHPNNDEENKLKRKYAYENKITTSHWPAPIRFASNEKTNEPLFDMKPYEKTLLELL